MKGVGKKREREGHETPADTLRHVVSLDFSETSSHSSQNNRSDDVSQIRFVRYQKQNTDESVENCRYTEAADAGASVKIDERHVAEGQRGNVQKHRCPGRPARRLRPEQHGWLWGRPRRQPRPEQRQQ